MSNSATTETARHLIWIYHGRLHEAMDAATWLEPTRELRRLGWRVDLLSGGPPGDQTIRGVTVTCLPMPDTFLVGKQIYHRHVLRFLHDHQDDVDVVLFHQMSAPWLWPARLRYSVSGGRRPRFVMDIRSVFMEPWHKTTWKGFLRGAYQGITGRTARLWVDGQTAITPKMAQVIGVPPAQLLGVWPSGVTPDLFAPAIAQRRWPQAEEPVELIYIGSLHHERRLGLFCAAVARAVTQGMRFRLTLVGAGTEADELRRLAAESNGAIRFLDPVPHSHVPQLLAQAHVGVAPFPDDLKFQVSSPIKLFEYMAAGMPMVLTHMVCHTDVVRDGRYVFWIRGDSVDAQCQALAHLWERRDELPTLGEAAAQAVDAWTWQAAARKLDNALRPALPTEMGAPAWEQSP